MKKMLRLTIITVGLLASLASGEETAVTCPPEFTNTGDPDCKCVRAVEVTKVGGTIELDICINVDKRNSKERKWRNLSVITVNEQRPILNPVVDV